MLGKLLPVLLALVGLGAGVGGGLALRPPPEMVHLENPCGDLHEAGEHVEDRAEPAAADPASVDFVKLNNQFVVPVVDGGRVGSLVVLSLSLEVSAGRTEEIYQYEPKLRDTFLKVLFDHASIGGFTGNFTQAARMNALRKALLESAKSVLGGNVTDVLILDFIRQDA